MKNFLTFFAALILCAAPFAAHADNPPVPARKTEALNELKSRIASEKNQAEALKKKMQSAEEQLEEARKELVSLSANLQASQKTLSDLGARIATLEKEEAALNVKIRADYGSMGNLILAMERLRRVPTEALIMRPGAPLETAQSALILQSILPAINARSEQMSADLNRMKTIHESLQADKAAADKTAATLAAQQKDLQALLKQRETLYGRTRNAYDHQAESVARMAAQAQSLEQLVARLEQSEREAAAREQEMRQKEKQAAAKNRVALKTPARARPPALPGGSWTSPIQGHIVSAFGDSDEIGAESKGIRLAAASNALVTAPAGGIIRFAGAFRNYGNMVIIEHDRGFHSLMSGLARIDTAVGRKISAGEPIGTLSGSGAAGLPTLYYELRHNGKPVDPSAKFPDLS